MGIYIEALILYILLFFSGASARSAEFSAIAELFRMLTYTIPALALIWYLIIKARMIEIWTIKPGKKDLVAGFLTFPFLLISGFTISAVSVYFGEPSQQVNFYSPSTGIEWIIICFSCFFSAYLEESFFRFYLISKREDFNLTAPAALVFSVLLFSVCHISAGPWSFLNSVICGTFFGFMYLRYNSLHGIAIVHALYNIAAVYLNTLK